MQADENRIRLQRDGVRHPGLAGGQVNRAMLSDGFSQHAGIVGRTVTSGAKGADIDPCVDRRQIQDVGPDWGWQCDQGCCLIDVLNRGDCAHIWIMKPMRKSLHCVHLCRTCYVLPALAIGRKNRNIPADDVFHVDLGTGIVLVANDYGGSGNVFHSSVLYPEFVGVLSVDGNRRRDILELGTDESQPGFALADRRFTLPLKRSVDQCKLPSRGGLPGPDAVLTSIKMHILSDVAAIVNSRKSVADMKVHVGQKAMLGIVGA